ncbi:hypothetical protein SSX86_017773 [Deinandra increscens subsp. villosa]|uniref:Cytochrome P450 n=1 Tax=Deinandra increscens subsp. villosa TaxID=3103831 RepID=A0AAP0GW02_9ASTR
MEVTTGFCVVGVVAAILVFYVWRVLDQLWLKPKKMEKCLRDQGLKGSPYKFFFGDLEEMEQKRNEATSKPMSLSNDIADRVFPLVYKSVTTYGKICFTWNGANPLVHVADPTLVREVFSNYRKFVRTKVANPLRSLLALGLFNTEGDRWVQNRKIINPAFHLEKIKHMEPSIYVSCVEMMEKWEELVTRENSSEVDVSPFFQSLAGDIISRTAFGSSFQEGRKIFVLQKELAELVAKIERSVYIPGSRFLPTKNNKRIKEIDREVKATIKGIIDKRMVAMKSGEASGDDLLGILLDSNQKEMKEHGNSKFGLTIDDVIEECKLFYFAGQDTTGHTLVWTMILLSQNNDWQTRAREEVLHVFGEKRPDNSGLNHLKTMNMILNEVLRLYPVVPTLARQMNEETKLGNLTLPAGTFLELNALLIHHDKDIWGEDANEFNPERFSEGVLKATKGQASYIPFGGGPRICIGQNFAMLEMKMALTMILQRFSFELSPSYSHAPINIITMQPQFGAHLILHKL